jgi:murein endopeptidase
LEDFILMALFPKIHKIWQGSEKKLCHYIKGKKTQMSWVIPTHTHTPHTHIHTHKHTHTKREREREIIG